MGYRYSDAELLWSNSSTFEAIVGIIYFIYYSHINFTFIVDVSPKTIEFLYKINFQLICINKFIYP